MWHAAHACAATTFRSVHASHSQSKTDSEAAPFRGSGGGEGRRGGAAKEVAATRAESASHVAAPALPPPAVKNESIAVCGDAIALGARYSNASCAARRGGDDTADAADDDEDDAAAATAEAAAPAPAAVASEPKKLAIEAAPT